jgi:hypothetical protein
MARRVKVKLIGDFQLFYVAIQLGEKQSSRIESASNNLHDYLTGYYGLGPDGVFPQGSVPNGTAVKPDPDDSGGEYDVDLVAVCASSSATPDQALEDLEAALEAHETYKKMVDKEDRKKPCVRLRYADDEIGGFHVDVTPARPCSGDAPLEIPRRGEGWQGTAPREYTDWCRNQGRDFAKLVQMLKRWRDHNQSARQAIKSIVLQVLVANHRVAADSDAEAVTGTLRAVATHLAASPSSAPKLPNPVLPSENLTERWSDSDYRNFRNALNEAVTLAESALAEQDTNTSRILWRELFGSDFPSPEEGGKFSPPPRPSTPRSRPQKAPDVEWG